MLADLIQNANTLFGEPSPHFEETTPAFSFSSFSSPEFSQPTWAQGQHPSTSTGFSFFSSPSDSHAEGRSPGVAQTTPIPSFSFGSFSSPEFPRPAEPQGVGSTSSYPSRSTGFSFSSSPSDSHREDRVPDPASPFSSLRGPGFPRSAGAQTADSTSRHPSRSTGFSFP